MNLFRAQTNGYPLSTLPIAICAFIACASASVLAQRVSINELQSLESVSEDQVVDVVRRIVFDGRTAETVQEDLRARAELKLMQLDTFCSLTSEQRQQLKLAAAGDATRFLHEVTNVGRKIGKQLEGKQLAQGEAVFLFQNCNVLSARLRDGIYRKDSLFEKVRDSTFNEDQLQKFETAFDVKVRRQPKIIPVNKSRLINE